MSGLTRGQRATLGILHEGALDEPDELGRGIAPQVLERRHRIGGQGQENCGSGITAERQPARAYLEDQHSQGPDIRPLIHMRATRLLRCHVRQRAERGPRLRDTRNGIGGRGLHFGQPEVENLHLPGGRQEDIGRLEVAMHHTGRVRHGEPISDVSGNYCDLGNGEGAALDARLQGFSLVIGHRDEELALEIPDFVDGRDIRVVERAGSLGLAE